MVFHMSSDIIDLIYLLRLLIYWMGNLYFRLYLILSNFNGPYHKYKVNNEYLLEHILTFLKIMVFTSNRQVNTFYLRQHRKMLKVNKLDQRKASLVFLKLDLCQTCLQHILKNLFKAIIYPYQRHVKLLFSQD
jgi:hypothetical protein